MLWFRAGNEKRSTFFVAPARITDYLPGKSQAGDI
jgi:hypothetical protein